MLENVLDPSHLPFTHHLTISNRAAAGPVHLRVVRNSQVDDDNNYEEKVEVDTLAMGETSVYEEGEAHTKSKDFSSAAAAVPSHSSSGGGIRAKGFAAVRWRPETDAVPPLTASPVSGNASGVVFKAPHLVVSSTVRPGSFTDWNVVTRRNSPSRQALSLETGRL